MLEQSTAMLIVTNSANLNLAKKFSRLPVINMEEIDQDTLAANPSLSLHLGRSVAIDYTSGSTDKPKGIVRTHCSKAA